MAKVLFLPGILGSELYQLGSIPLIDPDTRIWIDPGALLGGALLRLDYDAAADGPGALAGGARIRAGAPLPQWYYPMLLWLRVAGHDVWAGGYDWRRRVSQSGYSLWQQVRDWVGTQPLYIVAHSQGGLVARALWSYAATDPVTRTLGRMVTIGTPHYGCWEAARAWWHIARLYRLLLELTADWHLPWLGRAVAGGLDLILSSWPALYQLMPFRAAGPLWASHPDQAQSIYDVDWYGPGSNPQIRAGLLAGAVADQDLLSRQVPAAQMYEILGAGEQTPVALLPGGQPQDPAGYEYTDQGDGVVTVAQGLLPGVSSTVFPGSHELLPQLGVVQALVVALIAQGPAR